MRKSLNVITLTTFVLSVLLGIAAPVSGQACGCEGLHIIQPTGITQAVADGRYVNESGDTGMTGTHDYSIAILIAADAAAAGHVVTRSFGDGRYPQLAALNTFTKVNLFPDGTSTDPALAFASETGTGWWLAKAGKQGWTIGGTGTVVTLDTSNLDVDVGLLVGGALAVDGNTILGDTNSDTLTVKPDTVNWTSTNDIHHVHSSDALYTGAAVMRFVTSFQIAGNFEIEGTEGVLVSPGSDTDTTMVKAGVSGNPEMFWDESEDKFSFTKNIILPNGPPIVVVFGGGTDIPYFNTTNTAYTTVGVFLFGGTTALNTPSKISAIGFKDAGPTSWDVRVLDITNALTIAAKTGNTGTSPEIVDLGVLTNLPTSPAMFEVQIKRTGGLPADFVYIHNVTIDF